MEDEYILIYYTEGKYPGFQRKHIKYFSSYIFLQSYLNHHNKITKYFIYQRLNINPPIGKMMSL